MIVEQSVEWRLAGETEVLGENLPQRHFVHHKSHLTRPGTTIELLLETVFYSRSMQSGYKEDKWGDPVQLSVVSQPVKRRLGVSMCIICM
jgi:hypothetical protein